MDPSERLLPQEIVSNVPLANLLTRNWRDGAYARTNPIEKQLTAFMMIIAYLYLGTSVAATSDQTALGALTVAYGASSLAGYFNIGEAPLARLSRVNGLSVFGGLLGLGAIFSGAGSAAIWLLTMLHMFDIVQGATQDPARDEDNYDILPSENNSHGPIMSFFTESWRNNAINRSNFATCQTVQLVMMACQLYLALVGTVNGDLSPNLMGAFMVFVLASVYAFFNPVKVSGIDALQSNGAMVALMGAGTYNIVANGAGLPFVLLYSLLAVDCMASFSTYFSEHSQNAQWAGPHDPLRVITNPKGGSGGGSDGFNRQ